MGSSIPVLGSPEVEISDKAALEYCEFVSNTASPH